MANKKDNNFLTPGDIIGMEQKLLSEDGYKIRNGIYVPSSSLPMCFESMDELLEKDKARERDGFKKKIKINRVLTGPGRVIVVPYVEEEKLIHGEFEPMFDGDDGESEKQGDSGAGSGEGEVGDVIAERTLSGEGEGDDPGPAGQDPGEHGIEGEAYKMGKELSDKFELPNLKEKGKKVPTDQFSFDLTDRHRGSGQVLDKRETLKSIAKTNIVLGRLDRDNINTENFVVGPNDKVYRVLSKEKIWKSQAVVFFLRDYSGSMSGEPTKAVVTQHLMIYAWLLVQYEKLVVPRFIVHDTDAKEVSATEYYKLSASGGTRIASAYKKVNEIVESEGLDRDYNIYVFQGTDGEDWDSDGVLPLSELQKILGYANRVGSCVVKNFYNDNSESEFERYIKESGILEKKEIYRMYVMSSQGVTEDKNIEAIKELIAQN